MLQNNVELDLKTRLIEGGLTQYIPFLCEPHRKGSGTDRQ